MALSLDKMIRQNASRKIPLNPEATSASEIRPWEDMPEELAQRLKKSFLEDTECASVEFFSSIQDSCTTRVSNASDSGTYFA